MIDRFEVFAKGITEMAEKCPFNGDVTATFSIHAGQVTLKSVVPVEKHDGTTDGAEKKIQVFNRGVTEAILKDLGYYRINYGTIVIKVEVENGKLSSYIPGITPVYSARLLNARIKKWHMGETA